MADQANDNINQSRGYNMTDAEMVEDFKMGARGLVALSELATADPLKRAALLVNAATVVIEREVGVVLAPAALMALVEPSVDDWQARAAIVSGRA